MKYKVEYQLTETNEIKTEEFDNFIDAMKRQGEIVAKMKNKINYCIYK